VGLRIYINSLAATRGRRHGIVAAAALSRRKLVPVSFMWNVAYAEVPGNAGPGTGRGEGTDLRGISGISSQP
jgi:hypothetical protein